ncbi:MAG: HAD hydrolase family protein [Clostridia bacterium]|nr:HAD hydrolase family protein [Clostridia bacterium]
MIRAVFFDLDGTLLDSKKQIPESAKAAIRRCREKGVRIYFATARSPRLDQTLNWGEREFALFDGGIYSNGACVKLGEDAWYRFIDPKAVRLCVAEAEKYEDVHYSLHMPQEGYAFNFPVDASMHKGWGLAQARICTPDEEAMGRTLKVLLFYDHLTDSRRELPTALTSAIQCSCEGIARVYLTDAGRTIQLSSIEAGKLQTIERIRMDEGWSIDEVAVFGDDINDLEMIAFYPRSIAMGNGVEQVKRAAGWVTRANDEDGIAYALEQYLSQ